jgi:hypothetical protein
MEGARTRPNGPRAIIFIRRAIFRALGPFAFLLLHPLRAYFAEEMNIFQASKLSAQPRPFPLAKIAFKRNRLRSAGLINFQ